jgi:hypothetical protein
MKFGAMALLALVLAGSRLEAQSEARLKEYFEGKTVTLKLAIPGTEAGVDVSPGTPSRWTIPVTPTVSKTTVPRSRPIRPPW